MANETVARRYATALADVVEKTGESETVKGDLKDWKALIDSNANLQNLFANPSIAHMKKEGVLEGLLARSKPSKTAANFLRVLLKNGRLTDIADINERFASVLEERSGIVSGEVISAHELSAAQKKELNASLEKVTGKKVKLDYEIEKDIIGGVVARIGSTVYDSSVRTQLENLREQLLNG